MQVGLVTNVQGRQDWCRVQEGLVYQVGLVQGSKDGSKQVGLVKVRQQDWYRIGRTGRYRIGGTGIEQVGLVKGRQYQDWCRVGTRQYWCRVSMVNKPANNVTHVNFLVWWWWWSGGGVLGKFAAVTLQHFCKYAKYHKLFPRVY